MGKMSPDMRDKTHEALVHQRRVYTSTLFSEGEARLNIHEPS